MTNITVSRPKLVASMLGNPKKVTAMDSPTARHLVCTIFGQADKVKTKVSADKAGNPQTFEQIVGQFEGIPSEPLKDGDDVITAIQSGVLYLPSGIHERVASVLKGDDAPSVEFAIELYTVKATNPAGYSWEAREVIKSTAADPLTKMREAIAGKTKLLAAPTGAAKK